MESTFICNLCYLKTNNNGICCYHTTSEILSANIKTLELFLALIRQKMLENSKFIVFLHGKTSNIVWRPQRGGMCPVVSAGKKRTVSSKVYAKLYCSILKVS